MGDEVTNQDIMLELIFMQLTDAQIESEFEARKTIGAKPYAARFAATCNADELGLFSKTVGDLNSGVLFNVFRSQMCDETREVFDDLLVEATKRVHAKRELEAQS